MIGSFEGIAQLFLRICGTAFFFLGSETREIFRHSAISENLRIRWGEKMGLGIPRKSGTFRCLCILLIIVPLIRIGCGDCRILRRKILLAFDQRIGIGFG
jgi:hypothetical protein